MEASHSLGRLQILDLHYSISQLIEMPEQILDVTDKWEYDFFQALVPNYLAEMERN